MHIRIFVVSNLQFTLVPRFHGWTFLPKPDRVAVSLKNMRTLINSQTPCCPSKPSQPSSQILIWIFRASTGPNSMQSWTHLIVNAPTKYFGRNILYELLPSLFGFGSKPLALTTISWCQEYNLNPTKPLWYVFTVRSRLLRRGEICALYANRNYQLNDVYCC